MEHWKQTTTALFIFYFCSHETIFENYVISIFIQKKERSGYFKSR